MPASYAYEQFTVTRLRILLSRQLWIYSTGGKWPHSSWRSRVFGHSGGSFQGYWMSLSDKCKAPCWSTLPPDTS